MGSKCGWWRQWAWKQQEQPWKSRYGKDVRDAAESGAEEEEVVRLTDDAFGKYVDGGGRVFAPLKSLLVAVAENENRSAATATATDMESVFVVVEEVAIVRE